MIKSILNYIVGAIVALLLFSCNETQVSTIYNERELSEYDSVIVTEYLESKGIEAQKTTSGLYYDVLGTTNSGIKPNDTSKVTFDFVGKVLYNDIFESSEYNGLPLSFNIHRTRDVPTDSATLLRTFLEFESFRYNKEEIVDSTIVVRNYIAYRRLPGIVEAINLMQEGDSTMFYLPSHLAWGSRGAAPNIPSYSSLEVLIVMRKIE